MRSGVEQRDAAIKISVKGATTLLYRGDRFVVVRKGFPELQ
ncbi:MAG TPA: DUF4443 domain-containing protein [Nitrososphaeraceae archaeon]|nr:DUF4443 domain-containing protein [Nitrososphaeraceae archaeon]